jgi:type IV secretory pathway VirB4 component
MNEATLKKLATQAAEIAKQTAESLKHFDRNTAMLMYAKQMGDRKMNTEFPEGTEHKKTNNKEAAEKLDKMIQNAQLKWKYATDADKKKVMDMEKIMLQSDEKIRAVYAGIWPQ